MSYLPPPPPFPPHNPPPLIPPTAAVIHLTRTLAVTLGPRHILCNSIAPGLFPSKMTAGHMASQGGEAALAQTSPNGRIGKAEDVAGTVVYLASRAGAHVNGACVVVDGGAMWGTLKL